jgi:hypothetical protein
MAKVTVQRAVGLPHLRSAAFALRVVRFFQRYGNQAIVVAGRYFGTPAKPRPDRSRRRRMTANAL